MKYVKELKLFRVSGEYRDNIFSFFILGYSLIKGTFNLWNIQAGARYDQRSVITKEVIGGFDKIFSGVNYSAGISRSSKN